MGRLRNALFGVLTVASIAVPVRAADEAKVSPTDQVQFLQRQISAQMQELQDRMFRLAETTRAMEPDDSAKLILAVQRAREELIVEQMKDVIEALGRSDLNKAGDEQRQVLAKLEALKQLLLSGDLDLQAQLEQLRKLDAAIKKIDALTKQQEAHKAAAAAQAKMPTPDGKQVEAIKKDQEATKQQTETVTQSVQNLGEGGSKASQSLNGASSKMGGASSSLGGNKPGDATPQQEGAVNDLKQARKQLEEQRQKLIAELEKQVRKQVIMNLQEMLDRQKAVRESVQSLSASAAAGDREAEVGIRRLATAEQRIVTINDQTLELIRQTQFSVALPPALEEIGRRCVFLQNDLPGGKSGKPVIAQSKAIEEDLASLIDTFKELAASSNSQSQCKGCKGDKNKLLAELKVLRLLQTRVNQETVDIDGERAKALAEMPADLKAKIGTTHEHQVTARDAAEKIHKSVCPDCLAE